MIKIKNKKEMLVLYRLAQSIGLLCKVGIELTTELSVEF